MARVRPVSVLIAMGPVIQGGAEWQISELLRRMDRERFRPVLASVEFSSYDELVIGEGDRVIREQYETLSVPHYKITGHGKYSLANLRELITVIKAERIDLVHANLFAGELWGRLAALLTGTPVVTHKRGMPFKTRKPQNVLVDWLLNLASRRILVVNAAIKAELRRLQWLSAEKFSVVYPGVDPSEWKRSSDQEARALRRELGLEGKQVVTSVGRLRPIKGHKYLLDALVDIRERCPSAHLVLVGHGMLESELREHARRLRLAQAVSFLGMRSDIREVLSVSDVFILPSLSEASPVSLMEAAFVGVPTVATRVGGVPEVVQDGVTGTLVPPRDSRALADAVVELLTDADRRARMSEAAVRWAHQSFDIERTVRQIESEYCRALRGTC